MGEPTDHWENSMSYCWDRRGEGVPHSLGVKHGRTPEAESIEGLSNPPGRDWKGFQGKGDGGISKTHL